MSISDKLNYTAKWIKDIQTAIKSRKMTIDDETPLENFGDLIRGIAGVARSDIFVNQGACLSEQIILKKNTLKNKLDNTASIGDFVSTTVIHPKVLENDTVFDYTGYPQRVILLPGTYEIECYGAQGGVGLRDGTVVNNTAYGGYAYGVLTLNESKTLSINVGGMGGNATAASGNNATAGWNGGGWGGADTSDNDSAGGGGGASDVRLSGDVWDNTESLRLRIMVAGGSSGSTYNGAGHSGGGVSGGGTGGTQTSGYAFGIGQNGINSSGSGVSGAGGGYYGGTAVSHPGGGGSGFISGHPGCDAISENGIHTGQSIHYSGIYFTDTIMTSDVNSGDGKVIIRKISTT